MNISALRVFVFAVMSAYVYANIRCSDCNHPCSAHELHNVKKEITKIMNIPHCGKNIDNPDKANPKWECIQEEPDMHMIWPKKTYYYAKCGQCENNADAKPIVQDFNMLFRRSCKGTHNHTLFALELKPVTVSLGCTCVKS